MDLNDKVARIVQEYEFGRFNPLFEHIRALSDSFVYPGREDPVQAARLTLIDFVILDSRFKEALSWAKTREGNFPDLWMRHHHMNMLSDFGGKIYQKIPFYRDSPVELKSRGRELHQMCFRFYRLNFKKYDPDYIHGPENLVEDAEKTIVLAKKVLDTAYDYIHKLCLKK